MRKKHLIIILGCISFILLLILSVLIFRNNILKLYLEGYIKRQFGADSRVGKMDVGVNIIKLSNLDFSHSAADFNLNELSVNYTFPFNISQVSISEANIEIKSIKEFIRVFSKSIEIPSGMKKSRPDKMTCLFSLDNISFRAKESDSLNLAFNFSVCGFVKNNSLESIENLSVSGLNLTTKDFVINDVSFKKTQDKDYILTIGRFNMGKKEVKNLNIALNIGDKQATVFPVYHELLGNQGHIGGVINISNFPKISAQLNINDVSFTNLISFMAERKDITLEGMFNGEFDLCWENGLFSRISGEFLNADEGTIDIKEKGTLDFLKSRMDEGSYNTLVGNLKNYRYNDGEIIIRGDNKNLDISLHFDSEKMGSRNIVFSFHDLLGGPQ